MARPFRGDRTTRERDATLAFEQRIWDETGAAYAASQARAVTDDVTRPLALRGPDVTFTDDELKDF